MKLPPSGSSFPAPGVWKEMIHSVSVASTYHAARIAKFNRSRQLYSSFTFPKCNLITRTARDWFVGKIKELCCPVIIYTWVSPCQPSRLVNIDIDGSLSKSYSHSCSWSMLPDLNDFHLVCRVGRLNFRPMHRLVHDYQCLFGHLSWVKNLVLGTRYPKSCSYSYFGHMRS